MTNVLIVEDQRMTREYMEDYITKSGRYALAGSVSNAALAEMCCMNGRVDLILMDVCTAQDESGLRAASRIKKYFPEIKIIIVTSMPEHSFIEKARAAGAESFCYKDAGQKTLLEVMDRTMNGESVYPDAVPPLEIGLARSDEFTARELETLRLVVEGLTYAEIAEKLSVSVATVKFHVNNMLQKTGYTSKTQLAVSVINKKLILPGF